MLYSEEAILVSVQVSPHETSVQQNFQVFIRLNYFNFSNIACVAGMKT